MITIIDYGLGNISAFSNVLKRLNVKYRLATDYDSLKDSSKIILPGVGAFDFAMKKLNESGMRECLDDLVLEDKVPVLGICVGMQMMADSSDEGLEAGLGWIKGAIRKIDVTLLDHKPTVPHMGWNQVVPKAEELLFQSVDVEQGFYFLHSYYFDVENEKNTFATTYYGKEFSSAVVSGNILGVQFHPEKSLNNGVQLLKNFVEA